MNIIRNLLAIIGLAFVVIAIIFVTKFPFVWKLASDLDPGAGSVYMNMATELAKTGSPVEATIWKAKVKKGLTADDVEDAMKSVASEHNIKNVGMLPLYKEVAAMRGKPYRFAKIYMFCNALTAAKMMDYNDAFSAYLPCRVSLIEDKTGQLWIYTLNMDMMIYGGKPLPPELKKEAERVKMVITDIMNRGAIGDF